jgi:hypothetical protein
MLGEHREHVSGRDDPHNLTVSLKRDMADVRFQHAERNLEDPISDVDDHQVGAGHIGRPEVVGIDVICECSRNVTFGHHAEGAVRYPHQTQRRCPRR